MKWRTGAPRPVSLLLSRRTFLICPSPQGGRSCESWWGGTRTFLEHRVGGLNRTPIPGRRAYGAKRMPQVNIRNGLDFEAPILELEAKIEELKSFSQSTQVDLSDQIEKLTARCNEKKRLIFSKLTPWQKVLTARPPRRPLTSDYIHYMVEDWVELFGDRAFRDDPAIVTGFGRIGGQRVCLIGQRKGKDTAEKLACYFGCPHPEGYRKALLKMQLAEKFGIPIITLINTPGAYPGVGAEE